MKQLKIGTVFTIGEDTYRVYDIKVSWSTLINKWLCILFLVRNGEIETVLMSSLPADLTIVEVT